MFLLLLCTLDPVLLGTLGIQQQSVASYSAAFGVFQLGLLGLLEEWVPEHNHQKPVPGN